MGESITPRRLNRTISGLESNMAFTMKKVRSSMIEAIAYDARQRELLVRFSGTDAKTGLPRLRRTYLYQGVPKHVYSELLAVDKRPHGSVGKVFYSLVRQEAGYPCELVHTESWAS